MATVLLESTCKYEFGSNGLRDVKVFVRSFEKCDIILTFQNDDEMMMSSDVGRVFHTSNRKSLVRYQKFVQIPVFEPNFWQKFGQIILSGTYFRLKVV